MKTNDNFNAFSFIFYYTFLLEDEITVELPNKT